MAATGGNRSGLKRPARMVQVVPTTPVTLAGANAAGPSTTKAPAKSRKTDTTHVDQEFEEVRQDGTQAADEQFVQVTKIAAYSKGTSRFSFAPPGYGPQFV